MATTRSARAWLAPVLTTLTLAAALGTVGTAARAADAKLQGQGQAGADKDMRAVLDGQASLAPKPINRLDVTRARLQPTLADGVNEVLKKQRRNTRPADLVPGVTSMDMLVDGAEGKLQATTYTPEGTGPFPVVLYFHGGGWVVDDRRVYDASARGLSKQAQAIVVTVDYRRAPEAKFPAAWDDALAAYKWTVANAARFEGIPSQIALAGESAGGNLALATAVAARDAGLQAPAHVLAVYPVTQTSLDTESYVENATARPLDRDTVRWFVGQVTNSPQDLKDPRLQLIDAKLEGLAPVTLINARIDPLRSDGSKMEDALKKANVPVERRVYDGVTHEFFGAATVVEKAREAQAYAGERLRASFGS